jgi:hypothetical protein
MLHVEKWRFALEMKEAMQSLSLSLKCLELNIPEEMDKKLQEFIAA